MTNQEIASTLKSKGYQVSSISGIIIASLINRPVSLMEIKIALNHQIARQHMARTTTGATAILGQDGS